MNDSKILLQDLGKTYRVSVRAEGLGAALKSLVRPQYNEVTAVSGLNFQIESGEMTALLGPNGAGKTTTLKMLAGLLYPTTGTARVAGHIPWERHHDYLRQISMVLGNKSQMLWDIPPLDSFRVLAEIYQVPPQQYRQTLDELTALLEMEALLEKPVRNLSLGERMKCELVAALLHQPEVLFLDEPTLGLDVTMQVRLRQFFKTYNQRSGVTVLLTSHYMADVVALCERVILIHHGQLLYDGPLDALARQLAPFKLLRLSLKGGNAGLQSLLEKMPDLQVLEQGEGTLRLRVGREAVPEVTAALLQGLSVADLTVEDPPIEAVMDQAFQLTPGVEPGQIKEG